MAIKITLEKTERVLFCGSKWWGDPDMPENMLYPTIEVTEAGETFDYPLTFICQINCEDIARFDPDGKLPHEGMLYFFGAIDEMLGYEAPYSLGKGEWPKGHLVVKYAKTINFETFQSCQLVDDDNQGLTDLEMGIIFDECDDDAPCLKILGNLPEDIASEYPDYINLLKIDNLSIIIKDSDLKFGNWKRSKAVFR